MDSLVVLDPYPFETWIAYRTSGGGSGTASDPYDGSTADKFDKIMGNLPANVPVTVHLGPSPMDNQTPPKPIPFQTYGYYDGATPGYGWRARANLKIIGSGVDTTVLQLLVKYLVTGHSYAIAHDLSAPTKADYLEVSDLSIDCGFTSSGGGAVGAIRAIGDHVKIRRVKATNWGTAASGGSHPCYVFSLITALPDNLIPETVDSGFDECIAITPSEDNHGLATVWGIDGVRLIH